MMLCTVLVGDTIQLPQNGAITKPPVNPATGVGHDSVTGITGGSQVYIGACGS